MIEKIGTINIEKEYMMQENTILITDLLPQVQTLPRADKLRLMQSEQDYPVWTPYNASGAAQTLLNVIAEEKKAMLIEGQHFPLNRELK